MNPMEQYTSTGMITVARLKCIQGLCVDGEEARSSDVRELIAYSPQDATTVEAYFPGGARWFELRNVRNEPSELLLVESVM